MISQETVDRVKSRMNAIRIIGEYVKLERRGAATSACVLFTRKKLPASTSATNAISIIASVVG